MMDNFHFDMTCEGDKTLADALALVWSARGLSRERPPHARPEYKQPGATHYAIRPAFAGERHKKPEDAPAHFTPNWFREPKPARMVFFNRSYSSDKPPEDVVALPFTLDSEGAADFARRWLAEFDYGKQPDHDGDNGRGWRVYVEGWGQVDSDYHAIVAVAPAWAMYGK